MLQQDEPDDYVVATGETHSVRRVRARAASSTSGSTGRSTSSSTPRFSARPRSICWSAIPAKARAAARLEADGHVPRTWCGIMVDADLEVVRQGGVHTPRVG